MEGDVTTSIKVFTERPCLECYNLFQPVDWLPHRVEGYCSKKCCKARTERLAAIANENAPQAEAPGRSATSSSSA